MKVVFDNLANFLSISPNQTKFLPSVCLVPAELFCHSYFNLCRLLKKVLAHDYIPLTATTAAVIENDAIGCYDRLVNNLIEGTSGKGNRTFLKQNLLLL